jgi:DNA adenine methylase
MGFINNYSPLRYPGGKAAAAGYFMDILSANKIGTDGIYCEPYAGGAGVALTLLLTGRVESIAINDVDPCIAAFWDSLLKEPEKFMDTVANCEISIDSWQLHRKIYDNASSLNLNNAAERFELGFSTFFLNRTNRSGILPKAGPIGGSNQTGKFRLDARFKKDVLIERIKNITAVQNRIRFTSYDALVFLKNLQTSNLPQEKLFLYLDPPYYKKGKKLYLNFYTHSNHLELAHYISNFNHCKWLMTYDDCNEIRELYADPDITLTEFNIQYSIQHVRKAIEVMITPYVTKLPHLKAVA